MTITTLKERIAKANEKLQKKQNTISKKNTQIEKKIEKISKLGFDYEIIKNDCCNGDKNHDEAVQLRFDIHWLKDDIRRLENEVKHTCETISKYEAQLSGEIEKESLFVREMPKEFTALKEELTERWDEHDKSRREWANKVYEELGYKEFCRKYTMADYKIRTMTDEEIHKDNEKQAKAFIIDMYNRIRDITGEVTEWNGIRLEQGNAFPVLTGLVIGKNGRARIETVLAGGYNIQRLHIRTLVHEY